MICFVLTKIIKEDEIRTIGVFQTLIQAEERAKIHIESFNINNPEDKNLYL